MALPASLGNAAGSVLNSVSANISSGLASGLPAARSFLEGTLADLLRQWRTDTRLYTLASTSRTHPLPADLMVESFVLHDAVSEPCGRSCATRSTRRSASPRCWSWSKAT